MIMNQPIKMGGLGLRSAGDLSPAAFYGGLEQSLPHMCSQDGVCSHLQPLLGDNFRPIESRWKVLI